MMFVKYVDKFMFLCYFILWYLCLLPLVHFCLFCQRDEIKTFPRQRLQSAMWQHFTNTSIFRCCHGFGLSVAKSAWRHPALCHQLQSCNFWVTKPSFRHMSCYICNFGQSSYVSTFICRSAGLLKFGSMYSRHNGSVKQLQRCAFLKQLQHASSTKSFPTVVSGSVQRVSKRGIPKASDAYRLLSLAKPEKWKLFGENMLSMVL